MQLVSGAAIGRWLFCCLCHLALLLPLQLRIIAVLLTHTLSQDAGGSFRMASRGRFGALKFLTIHFNSLFFCTKTEIVCTQPSLLVICSDDPTISPYHHDKAKVAERNIPGLGQKAPFACLIAREHQLSTHKDWTQKLQQGNVKSRASKGKPLALAVQLGQFRKAHDGLQEAAEVCTADLDA